MSSDDPFDINNKVQQIRWVLIIDWPGLNSIYPVKLTRSITLNTLSRQFGTHILHCPPSLDKVLYSISKNKNFGCDAEYSFLLETTRRYLENPTSFVIENSMTFDDFLIKEFCMYFIDKYNKDLKTSVEIKASIKRKAMSTFMNARKKRILEEAYLKPTFAEDFQRSHGELSKILNRFNNVKI
jgi:hypothetical protein